MPHHFSCCLQAKSLAEVQSDRSDGEELLTSVFNISILPAIMKSIETGEPVPIRKEILPSFMSMFRNFLNVMTS